MLPEALGVFGIVLMGLGMVMAGLFFLMPVFVYLIHHNICKILRELQQIDMT